MKSERRLLYLVCGALTTLLRPVSLAQPCPSIEPGGLVINEILFDRPDPPIEFVELYNGSSCSIDLGRLTLSDSRGTREPVSGAAGWVEPASFVVLTADARSFSLAFPGVPVVIVERWPALNNGGDAVVVAAEGVVLDSVRYAGVWGIAGRSLERRNPRAAPNSVTNWGPSTDPSGGTPGRQNSLFVLDTEPPRLVYAEQDAERTLYATFSEPPDLSRLHASQFSTGDQYAFRIEPAATADAVRIEFAAPVAAPVLQVRDLADEAGNVAMPHQVPIVGLPSPGELVLNEIMYDPRLEAPAQPEYVEILNASNRLLSIRGLALTEDSANDVSVGQSPLTNERRSLSSGALLVVHDADDVLAVGDAPPPAFSSFGLDAGDGAVWLSVSSVTTRGLSNAGQTIVLRNRDGTALDAVTYAPYWHSLTVRQTAETRGTALERRSHSVGEGADAWTSSVAGSGGTPGRANSVLVAGAAGRLPRPGIEVAPSPFSPDDDGRDDIVQIRYRLSSPVALVRVHVFDLAGRIRRRIQDARISGSEGALFWDGADEAGVPVPTGPYVIVLEGIAAESASIERHKHLVTVVTP